MKAQNIKIVMASLFACMMLFSSCNNSSDLPQNSPDDQANIHTETTEKPATAAVTEPACINHTYERNIKTEALALRDGEIEYVCTNCKHSYSESIPATKSIKVLALGNSFTVDSMHHLWNICKDGGAETVVLGNLYIGSCTLDKHWANISKSSPAYKYYKNTDGTWVTKENYKIIDALKQEPWDYIVLHQTSGSAGLTNTFSNLDNIIDFINANKTNPDAKIIWHMPWAYQSDSTHVEFPNYDRDQMKMYQAITSRVNELILTRETIAAIIPSGTAIQNLRTSYIGDTVTRDGYHLNYGFGRYTASLMWYSVLTGGNIDVIDWIPDKYPDVQSYLPTLKDAAATAAANPFKITESAFPLSRIPVVVPTPIDPSAVLNPEDYLEADTALAKAFGVDLAAYKLLSWDYLKNTYWYCTSKTGTTTPKASAGTYNQNICTKVKYSIEDELPVGTIFICDPGWRYRMEIYPSEKAVYTGIRPEGSTAPFYVLSEDFLKGCKYIAWSVSTYPKTDISAIFDQAYAHIRVYVPTEK